MRSSLALLSLMSSYTWTTLLQCLFSFGDSGHVAFPIKVCNQEAGKEKD